MTNSFIGKISLVKVPASSNQDPAKASPDGEGAKTNSRFADMLASLGSATEDRPSPLHVEADGPSPEGVPAQPSPHGKLPKARIPQPIDFEPMPAPTEKGTIPAAPQKMHTRSGAFAAAHHPLRPVPPRHTEHLLGLKHTTQRAIPLDDEPPVDPIIAAFTTPLGRRVLRADGALPAEEVNEFDEPTIEIRIPVPEMPVPRPALERSPLIESFDIPQPRPEHDLAGRDMPHAEQKVPQAAAPDAPAFDAASVDLDAPLPDTPHAVAAPSARTLALADALSQLNTPAALDLAQVIEAALVDAAKTVQENFTIELHKTHARIVMPVEGQEPLELEVYVDQDRVRIQATGSTADLLMRKTHELAGSLSDAGFAFDGWQDPDGSADGQPDPREETTERFSRKAGPSSSSTSSSPRRPSGRSVLA